MALRPHAPVGLLGSIVVLLALLPGPPAAPASSEPGAGAAAKRFKASPTERRLARCTNARRKANGRAPLKMATRLNRAARLHARNMVRHGFFSHTDHKGRGPAERVRLFAPPGMFGSIGENIAAGYRSARAACAALMRSSGHRSNMLQRRYDRIGVGFARGGPYGRYYVQVFARKG